jgi:large subunit ribosomal protein L24
MNIKKDDKVKLLSGKDKGKTGKVLQVFPKEKKISVEGLNLLIKNLRPRKQGEKGQRIEFPAWFNESKAMLVCPKCGRAARVGIKIVKENEKTKKYRFCKKCQETIE